MEDFFFCGGGHDGVGYVGEVAPRLQRSPLSAEERAGLLEFLGSLDGDKSGEPWNYWPSR